MKTVTTIVSLREQLRVLRKGARSIAIVPTMGNLHRGHQRLVDVAKTLADRVVATIFVNPTQFGEGEDYQSYPRTLDDDIQTLLDLGTDVLFAPDTDEIYPGSYQLATYVEVPELSSILCGEFRPGHFRGVTTVVCKLLNIVQPDSAVFGKKDFQQLVAIGRMVKDLDIPVTIHGVTTVREEDGLALSSRNAFLSEQERTLAPLLYRTLIEARDEILGGNTNFGKIETRCFSKLIVAGFSPDYFSIRRSDDLKRAVGQDRNLVILTAAKLGKARLIDNLEVEMC